MYRGLNLRLMNDLVVPLSELNNMIAKQSLKDATIYVDPTNNGVRIYSKWKNSHEFTFTSEMYAIYNKVAEHIKKI